MNLVSSGHGHFFIKKAYEICYALFRIAGNIKKLSFAEHLENQGLILLESVTSSNYEISGSSLVAIEYILKIGVDLGIVHNSNYEVLSLEIKNLNSAIIEFGNSAKSSEVDIAEIFSKVSISKLAVNEKEEEKIIHNSQTFKDAEKYQINRNIGNTANDNSGGGHNGNSAIRQSAILDRVRQNENCRLKEIQEILPGTSERTIRYDLQGLLEHGLIERIGNGGPATHYRAIRVVELQTVNSRT